MIPTAFITAWRKNAKWIEASQVEQNLISVEKTGEETGEETGEKKWEV